MSTQDKALIESILRENIYQPTIDRHNEFIGKINNGRSDLIPRYEEHRNAIIRQIAENILVDGKRIDYKGLTGDLNEQNASSNSVNNSIKKIYLHDDKELGFTVILFALPPDAKTALHGHQHEPCCSITLEGQKSEWLYRTEDVHAARAKGAEIENITDPLEKNKLYGDVVVNPTNIKFLGKLEISAVGQNLEDNYHVIANASKSEPLYLLHVYGNLEIDKNKGTVQSIQRSESGDAITAVDFTRALKNVIPGTNIIQESSYDLSIVHASHYR